MNLLDTHTVIWYLEGDGNLSAVAKSEIEKPEAKNFVSMATLLEIAIKLSIGKLKLPRGFDALPNLFDENLFEVLPITFRHTQQLTRLPLFHRDPFDRLLVAQAIVENYAVITIDKEIHKYPIKTIW